MLYHSFTACIFSKKVYILVQWLGWVNDNIIQVTTSYIVPIGMGIVTFACMYETLLFLDAAHHKNNILLAAICVSNVCVFVYSVLQCMKMRETTHTLQFNYDIVGRPLADPTRDIWISMQPAEILIPLVLGLASLTIIPIAYRLHKDYAWAIYKSIYGSADLRLRFDFFFLVGLAIQYNLIDVHFQEPEYSLTMAIIPATILIMFFGTYCVKSELRLGMGIVVVSFPPRINGHLLSRIIILCGNAQRANTPGKEMMLLFAVVTLALIVTTLVCTIQCTRNFGSGLKNVIHQETQWPRNSYVFERLSSHGNSSADTRYDTRYSPRLSLD
ncbi:uncharacterized protein BDW43DRAFT_299543 [Aspergillus alliaceus]|uniref:uncharacterized protein n=1 Tax=Petromyces alliaceus TaxID=209559 RepID=UPI0012A3DB65|nr:uncharacterized protein BDW43DRAFT_299543 [Aspergillus alliaceus]KAB8234472.1 hypothetical protein BDW43DRAFT_299543 [Aspergillus alliaceus]